MRIPVRLRVRVGPMALIAVLLLAPAPGSAAEEAVRPPQELTASIPPRPASAPGGSELMRRLSGLAPDARRRAVVEELARGNIPDFLRRLRPVELAPPAGKSGQPRATVWVMPDYLSVGSDDDFVRVPLGLYSAITVARELGFVLPTRKIVDAIHRQADRRLRPLPMEPGPRMTSVEYLVEHHRRIEEQLAGFARDGLVAGHKKDLVLTNRLAARARKVAIYGWHRRDGNAIQPLSTVHEARYADYSHGLRLVAGTAFVDGSPVPVLDLLEDPRRAGLLTREGPIRHAKQLMTLTLSGQPEPAADGKPAD